jgi:hypothetical protein
MHPIFPLTLAISACFVVPSFAQQLALDGSYGTAAGCALINGERTIPDGKVRALAADRALNDDAICTILDSSEPVLEGGQTIWEANIVCEAGHEEAEHGKLRIALHEDKQAVDLKLLEGSGPKGKLNLCP